jgi:serine protease Do
MSDTFTLKIRRSNRLPALVAVIAFLIALIGFTFDRAESDPTASAASTNHDSSFLNGGKSGTPPLSPSVLKAALPQNLWIELNKVINPAVVSITTATMVRQANQGGRGFRDPLEEFLEEFYGGGAMGGGPRGMIPQQQQPMMALGTGFIIREDGLIITNNHVVEQADVIKVQLDENDSKLYQAEVIGRDPRTDIAVIKIDAKKSLPFVRLGESKSVQVGQFVAAFGNPYGHAHTLTVGILSAIGREIAEINRIPFLQTDASINPGNSGGPLVDTDGYVIGVNTAIDARAHGIGFAIPIDNVKLIVAQLLKDGRVERGYIGVGIASINDEIAGQLGMREPTGVLITQVLPNGPADQAGLKTYDVVHEIDGKKVRNAGEMQNAIGDKKIESEVKLKVWRFDENGGRRDVTLNVRVAENPDDKRVTAKSTKRYFGQKAPFDVGFNVADWSTQTAREFNVQPGTPQGPIVTEVAPKSPAAIAGIQPGDVILDVNRQAVSRATDVLKHLKSGANFLRLARGPMAIIVSIGQ